MKNINSKDLFKNMSATIFGHKIDNVLTKAGSAIDGLRGEDGEDGKATKIGSILDTLTSDIDIKIGGKKSK